MKLKEVIKQANIRFVNRLEMDYTMEDKRTTYLGPKLARIYLEGKIIPKNIQRAVEILNSSNLTKSKYMLMRLSVEQERYKDAYYYSEFLNHAKCNCEVSRSPLKRSRDRRAKPAPEMHTAVLILEKKKDMKCYR